MPEDEKAAESSSVEVPEVEKGTSAETQNTDPESTKGENENPVPQSRFTEVVDERNDLREKLGALKSRLDTLEKPAPEKEEEPGEGASELDRAKWLIKTTLEDELGMSLDVAKQRLGKVESVSSSSELVRWENACGKAGLNPDDKDLQSMVLGLSQRDQDSSIDELLTKAKKYFSPKEKPAARVETETVTGPLQPTDWIPKNAAEASEGAAKGKRAKHLSSAEIIARRLAQR